MSEISQFPKDNHLWLIKLIDGFTLPHLQTKSAAVSVLLQKLPFNDPARLNHLTEKEMHSILRESPSETNPVFLTPCPQVLVGYLPILHIGAVYKNQQYVGDLPTSTRRITMPRVEDSCIEKKLSDHLPSPEGWTAGPYRTLNRFEYSYEWARFSQSRCIVCESNGTEYIIPRMAIFKAFYAINYIFARAFTNGPWPEQLETIVYMHELDSGLKTQIHPETGNCDIILQFNIPASLANLLALYLFDSYAKSCAEAIYSRALQDRGPQGSTPWHASARIPFRPSSSPVLFDVSGYELPPFYRASTGKSHKRFFVTRIHGYSFPDYMPSVSYDFKISRSVGDKVTIIDGPPPFSSAKRDKFPCPQTKLESNLDSNPELAPTLLIEDAVYWINTRAPERLHKNSSKTYIGQQRLGDTGHYSGDSVSAGNNTHSNLSLPEAKIQTLIREPEKKFKYLLIALTELKNDGYIDGYKVFPPIEHSQTFMRDGYPCWNFFSEESRITGKWPKHGWRVVKLKNAHESSTSLRVQPRAALVVEITHRGNRGYWIEIESQTSSYRSVLIYGVKFTIIDECAIIARCLEIIASNEGRNLEKSLLKDMLQTGHGHAIAYTHQYMSRDSAKFDLRSIINFISRMSK